MELKPSPYEPITPKLAASGQLVPIKQSAADEQACESTLQTNAKARRLRAFQAHFGAPVMVLPSDVKEFLKSRKDIASKHHPKGISAVSSAGVPPVVEKPPFRTDSPFPDAEGHRGSSGDHGIGITLCSLAHTTPSERALVAKAFSEVARQITETLPSSTGNEPQH